MKNLNPTVVFLVGTVIVLAALFIPGMVGGVLLLLVAAVAAALLMGTWHRLTQCAAGNGAIRTYFSRSAGARSPGCARRWSRSIRRRWAVW